MPKILRIINRLNLGGPTHNVAFLTKYLPSEYETLLLSGQIDSTEASSEFLVKELDLTPKYIDNMQRELNPFNDRHAYLQIKKIIKEFKPDIVHTHAAKAGAVGRLAAAHCNVPVIVHTFHGHVFHSYFGALKTRIFLEIERYLAKKSTAIIAISDIQKNELADTFKIAPAEKFHVVNLGFDLEKFNTNKQEKRNTFRKKWKLDYDEIAIGIVGRIVPIKNHSMFLDAMKTVLDKTTKKVKILLIGDGESRNEIEEKIKALNISYTDDKVIDENAKIIFCSWIKDVDVAYEGLDIVALSSLNEGTPVSLIEAQASGTPIITTNVGGIKDVVLENQTAFVVESNDTNGFAMKTLELVENDELRKDFSKRGYNHVIEKFSYQRLCRDVDQLYKKLLSK
jgi:glycosyltransferase involved in cell wall biosynthesis